MGQGIESVLAFLSNAATATAQAMTAGTGQTFTIRATAGGSAPVALVGVHADFQDAGDFRVRSPRMHDDVNGIRIGAESRPIDHVFGGGESNLLYSQDTLTVESVFTVAPTAAHISLALMQVMYADVPGIAANMRSWAEVAPNIVQYLSVPVSPTSGATAGNWGTGVAINSTVDVFKANTLYALLGFVAPTAFGAWSIQGVDIGNLQYGSGGFTNPRASRGYFKDLSDETGQPAIPVINSQNKSTTLVFAADRTASTAFEVSLIFAQLSA